MVTVLDRPVIQEAPTILERPTRCGEEETDEDKEYLFYEGDTIVYRVSADCYVCGWKDGHPRFPQALMAVAFEMQSDWTERLCRCAERNHRGAFIFFEGNAIVGRTHSYCAGNAWREGHPRWPLAQLAGNIPMEPSDIDLRCRYD